MILYKSMQTLAEKGSSQTGVLAKYGPWFREAFSKEKSSSAHGKVPVVGDVTYAQNNIVQPITAEVCPLPNKKTICTSLSANTQQNNCLKIIRRPHESFLMRRSFCQQASLQQPQEPTPPALDLSAIAAWNSLSGILDGWTRTSVAIPLALELPANLTSPHHSRSSSDTSVDSPPQRSTLSVPHPNHVDFLTDKNPADIDKTQHLHANTHKNEENKRNDIGLATVIARLESLHDIEVAQLRSELFTAETTVNARDVDLANDHDDYEAALNALREERDEAEKSLSERDQELEYAINKMRKFGNEAKTAKEDNKNLRRDLNVWQQRTQEAMGIAEDLKADLNEVREEGRMLTARNSSARTMWDQRSQIQVLQTNLQNNESEMNDLRGAYEFLSTKYSEEQEKNKKLQVDVHFAGLEVGYIHLLNMGYRATLEDQPERTAHLDALLKRKDEVHNNLAQRYDECAKQRAEQQLIRDVDRERFSGVRERLLREVASLKEQNEELKETCNDHRHQNEDIREMFTRKIFKKDMVKAINAEHEVLKKDNNSLIKMVCARDVRVQEVIAEISPLKVQILELENALEMSAFEQRELQAKVNGLDLRKCNLEVALQTQEGDSEQKMKDLEAALQAKKQKMEDIIKEAASPSVQRYLDVKNAEIERLSGEYRKLDEISWGWYHRTLEMHADFDPVLRPGNLNFAVEGKDQRLRLAEKMLGDLEKKLKERGMWEAIRGEADPRCHELEEVEALIENYARFRDV